MNNFFNIALVPEHENLIRTCIQLAQANLKGQSDQYLLGENAWPHITLCQFISEHGQLGQIWQATRKMSTKPVLISFEHIFILPGEGIHEGKYWVGLIVTKTTELINLQKSIHEKLHSLGVEGLTSPETYSPHLTWARCDSRQPIALSKLPTKKIWQNQHPFDLSIGLSDINGVYRDCLFSDFHKIHH